MKLVGGTPGFVLDLGRLDRNLGEMRERAERLGVRLRGHQKTGKCVEVATRAVGPGGPITVSTAGEARFFAAAGFRDMALAVGMTGGRLAPLRDLLADGVGIGVVVDSVEAVLDIAAVVAGWALPAALRVHVEIDCGGARGGVEPGGDRLVEVASAIASSGGLEMAGVLTHAGHSYAASSLDAIRGVAEEERAAAVLAAERVRAVGIDCESVSVGSTPTAIAADSLDGVTEMRPGVYALFDLYQESLGVCGRDDIAGWVVATVIGHHRDGHALIDAGALALSLDPGPRGGDTGFGLVTALDGSLIEGKRLRVRAVHQEHGFVESLDGAVDPASWSIGSQVRVIPNHACLTAAGFDRFQVVRDGVWMAMWESLVGC